MQVFVNHGIYFERDDGYALLLKSCNGISVGIARSRVSLKYRDFLIEMSVFFYYFLVYDL